MWMFVSFTVVPPRFGIIDAMTLAYGSRYFLFSMGTMEVVPSA